MVDTAVRRKDPWRAVSGLRTALLLGVLPGAILVALLMPAAFILGTSEVWWRLVRDQAWHVAGHLHFIQSAWQFPILLTDQYNAPQGINIFLTDSLPLLSLVAKLLHTVSGQTVNAFGLWYAAIFVLQSLTGALLVRALGARSPVAVLAGATFAVLMPTFLFRSGHLALNGHFAVLGALVLYVQTLRSGPRAGAAQAWFSAYTGVILLIHSYLWIMAVALWAASLMDDAWRRRAGIRYILGQLGGFAGLTLAVMLATGLLQAARGGAEGFGIASMNLLSPLWFGQGAVLGPHLPPLPMDATGVQLEGFNYLGLGAILVVIAGLIVGIRWIPGVVRYHPALFLALAACTIFALSNVIYAGPAKIISLELPNPVLGLANIFRASGRFFWPVAYLAVGAAIAALLLAAEKRGRATQIAAAAFLTAAAAVQVADVAPWLRSLVWTRQPEAAMPQEAEWRTFIGWHERLDIFPPHSCRVREPNASAFDLRLQLATGWFGIPVNSADAARPVADCPLQERRMWEAVSRNSATPGSLLMFFAPSVEVLRSAETTGLIDQCRWAWFGLACSDRWLDSGVPNALMAATLATAGSSAMPVIAVGRSLDFKPFATGNAILGSGWSGQEASGRSSDGNRAQLAFAVDRRALENGAALDLTVLPFLRSEIDRQRVQIEINATRRLDAVLDRHELQTLSIPLLPGDVGPHGHVMLTLELPDARSPASLGLNADQRRLALFLTSLALSPKQD